MPRQRQAGSRLPSPSLLLALALVLLPWHFAAHGASSLQAWDPLKQIHLPGCHRRLVQLLVSGRPGMEMAVLGAKQHSPREQEKGLKWRQVQEQ